MKDLIPCKDGIGYQLSDEALSKALVDEKNEAIHIKELEIENKENKRLAIACMILLIIAGPIAGLLFG